MYWRDLHVTFKVNYLPPDCLRFSVARVWKRTRSERVPEVCEGATATIDIIDQALLRV